MLVILAGCSGAGSQFLPSGDRTGETSQVTAGWQRPGVPEDQQQRAWQAWLADPGRPGVDYDPGTIIVSYQAGARVPSRFASAAPATGTRAADGPNAILRHDRSYEPLTDAIAGAFGLAIQHQVYNETSRWATFHLGAGQDSQAVLAGIRRDFAASIEYAAFAGYEKPCWQPNDPDYLRAVHAGGYIAPPEQWGQHIIGCETAWEYSRGDAGVLVAVIDDAFRLSHEELTNTVLKPQLSFPSNRLDVADNDNDVTPGGSGLSHGTEVVGLAGAQGNNARTITGVAPECRFIPIKVAKSSSGDMLNTDSAVAINLAVDLGAKVINCSYGGQGYLEAESAACRRAHNNGVLVVAAAGNESTTAAQYPAAYQNVFCVGATGELPNMNDLGSWQPDQRSSFSNYGDYVDIAAPGCYLKSVAAASDNAYDDWFGGTSAASPITAGCAALLMSRVPTLTVNDVANYIIANGAPTTGFPIGNVKRVDIGAAMTAALPRYTIAGQVVDMDWQPVVGAEVMLEGVGSQITTTGGTFSFTSVINGTYSVSVIATGFNFPEPMQSADITSGDKLDIVFQGVRSNEPLLQGISVSGGTLYGKLFSSLLLQVSAYGAMNVDHVDYTLDLAPVGTDGANDIKQTVPASTADYTALLDIPATIHNQLAVLRAVPVHSDGTRGLERTADICIFNQRGDANCDGVVDAADIPLFFSSFGTVSGAAGFNQFCDSDLDGVITEADASAVGYFYSGT